jgi:hypothetical protein
MIYKKFLVGISSENVLVEQPTVQRCEMRLFTPLKQLALNQKKNTSQ